MPICGIHLIIYVKGIFVSQEDIKSTHADALCCITAASRFKFARFDYTDSNVRKRLFETGRTTALGSRSIDIFYVPAHAWTGRKMCLKTQNPLQR